MITGTESRGRRGAISELLPAMLVIGLLIAVGLSAFIIFYNHYTRTSSSYFKTMSNITKNPIPGVFSAQLIRIAPAKYSIAVYNPSDTMITVSASIVCNITGNLTLVYGPRIITVNPSSISFQTVLLPARAVDADFCYLVVEQGPVIIKIPES